MDIIRLVECVRFLCWVVVHDRYKVDGDDTKAEDIVEEEKEMALGSHLDRYAK